MRCGLCCRFTGSFFWFFFHRYSKQTLQFLTALIRSAQECDGCSLVSIQIQIRHKNKFAKWRRINTQESSELGNKQHALIRGVSTSSFAFSSTAKHYCTAAGRWKPTTRVLKVLNTIFYCQPAAIQTAKRHFPPNPRLIKMRKWHKLGIKLGHLDVTDGRPCRAYFPN